MTGSAETTELPLTLGQLQHFKVTRENPALRMAIWSCFRIPGELDVDKFTDSVEILVSRHEALRIEIVERPGSEPRQRVRGLPPRAGLITVQNVLARSEDQFGRYLRHLMVQRYRREWDAGGYPFSFGLFRYSPTVHALMVGLSHMAVDGVGAGILVRDLMRTYADTLAGRAPAGRPDGDMPTRSSGGRPARRRRPAHRRAGPLGPAVAHPVRRAASRPARAGRPDQAVLLLARRDRARGAQEQAGLHGCTEFTWVLAAFARTVFRFTRQDRIAVAVPVDLRGPAGAVVGMYVVEVPVVVERPRDAGAGRGFVAAVGTAVLRAAVRYRRDRAWDEEHPTDLSVNYRKMTGPDGPELARLGGTGYRPRIDYEASGVGLRIFSYRDVLHAQAVFASGLFSADAAEDLSGVLRTNLTSVPGR